MRGFIKVSVHLYFVPVSSLKNYSKLFQHDPLFTDVVEEMYIRKADVLQVEKILTFEDLTSWVWSNNRSDRGPACKEFAAIQMLDVECFCGAEEIWKSLKPGATNETHCSCIPEETFPLYIIKCKNKISVSHFEGTKDFVSFVPKVATYIVDQSERENMERFLAGTDDPLYDYVHLLQYGPNGGTEVAKAKEEFESATKKLKTNT